MMNSIRSRNILDTYHMKSSIKSQSNLSNFLKIHTTSYIGNLIHRCDYHVRSKYRTIDAYHYANRTRETIVDIKSIS